MRIVINHLTRMRTPRIRLAGIDPRSLRAVRPTTPPGYPITHDLLEVNGGPLALGTEVDLGHVRPDGSAPETEDHRFDRAALRHVRDLDGNEFHALLSRVARPDLDAAFGPALRRRRWKFAIDEGEGHCSLAVVRCGSRPTLEIDETFGNPRLQLKWSDPDPPTYLPVTDVRFYEQEDGTIRRDLVEAAAERLRRGVGCMLMLGVARPWKAEGDTKHRHWLQLNGLVLDDCPVGDTP